jgi:hypothetical protein
VVNGGIDKAYLYKGAGQDVDLHHTAVPRVDDEDGGVGPRSGLHGPRKAELGLLTNKSSRTWPSKRAHDLRQGRVQ